MRRIDCYCFNDGEKSSGLGQADAVGVGIKHQFSHAFRVINNQLLGDRGPHRNPIHMHAVVAKSRHQPASVICIQGDRWCRIVVSAVSHSPGVIDIHMVFRCQDTNEGLIPLRIHGSTESRDHQDRFAGSEFTVSQPDPIDLRVLDRCCVDRNNLKILSYLNLWLGNNTRGTRTSCCGEKAEGEGDCQSKNQCPFHKKSHNRFYVLEIRCSGIWAYSKERKKFTGKGKPGLIESLAGSYAGSPGGPPPRVIMISRLFQLHRYSIHLLNRLGMDKKAVFRSHLPGSDELVGIPWY